MPQRRKRPAPEGPLRGEMLCGAEAAKALENHWRRLEWRSVEPLTGFQTADWCLGWIASFGTGEKALGEPRLVCVWQGKRLVALWPAMLCRKALGAKVLKPLGVPHTQYAAALVDPAADRAALVKVMANVLSSTGNVDLVHADPVPAGSFLAEVFGSGAKAKSTGNEAGMLRLEGLSSLGEFESTLSAAQRKSRRRRRNQLEKLGTPSFRVVWPGEPDHGALMETCVAWKVRWLTETGRVSAGFSIRGYGDFLAALPGEAEEKSGSVLFVLEMDGEPVAMEHALLHARHLYSYIGSFDWDRRELSAGKVLMGEVVDWAIRNDIQAYDLLGNPADYKSGWTNHGVPLRSFGLPVSLRGKLYSRYWLAMLKPGLKQAWLAAPSRWRRTVTQAVTG